MTLVIKLRDALEDPDDELTIFRVDPLLSAGSLLLVDPTNAAGPWAAGVPANAATLPNIAWREARDLLDNGQTEATLKPTFLTSDFDDDLGFHERTTLGGFHAIPTQDAYPGSGDFYDQIKLPTPLIEYICAVSALTPKHDIFFALWRRITRATPGTVSIIPSASFAKAPAGNEDGQWLVGHVTSSNLPISAQRIGSRAEDPNTVGPTYQSIAGKPKNAMVAADYLIDANASVFRAGRVGPFGNNVTHDNQAPASILYGVYVEDLTASGRTFATVDALSHARYTADVLTSGGRYYGDTFSDPDTVLP